MVPRRMSNVLDEQKQHEILALGRLGWTLQPDRGGDGRPSRDGRRVPARRGDSRARPRPARRRDGKTDNFPPEVSTDLGRQNRPFSPEVSTDSAPARAPSASACEIYREVITDALASRAQRDGDLAGPGR